MKRIALVCAVIVAIAITAVDTSCFAQNNQPQPVAPTPKVLPGPTLAAMIGGSLNSKQFCTWYIAEGGQVKDAVDGGDKSCVLYITSLLHNCGLLPEVCLDVDTMLAAFKKEGSGWKECPADEKEASIVVAIWGEKYGNRHAGFVFPGTNTAVSHSSITLCPMRHGLVLRDGRTVSQRWTHPALVGLHDFLVKHGVL